MKPKKINFELIPEYGEDDQPTEPYSLMRVIRLAHHSSINNATIALAWRTDLKPDPDGHLVLGRCIRTSDLQREFANYDFIILLNQEVWNEDEFTQDKKRALIDHELCHAEAAVDKLSGTEKYDERGRQLFRTKKHDIEEFYAIVRRHGCYKRDLELFAEELLKKKAEKKAS